jgi:DNA-binding transcriptional MerR regulator
MSFTVGQLAKLTGLTVRALHHYHAIGLLEPSQRSDSGYRLYTEVDIVRLFRIQALQRLNLSLDEIAAVLEKDGAPLPEMIAQQLDELDDRIDKATALRSRLSQLHEVLTRGGEPVAGDWLAAVELITQYDKYCSSDELQRLLVHSNAEKDQWRSIIAELREAVRRDVPAQSEHAQTLADRWMQLMLSRVGGDVGPRDQDEAGIPRAAGSAGAHASAERAGSRNAGLPDAGVAARQPCGVGQASRSARARAAADTGRPPARTAASRGRAANRDGRGCRRRWRRRAGRSSPNGNLSSTNFPAATRRSRIACTRRCTRTRCCSDAGRWIHR